MNEIQTVVGLLACLGVTVDKVRRKENGFELAVDGEPFSQVIVAVSPHRVGALLAPYPELAPVVRMIDHLPTNRSTRSICNTLRDRACRSGWAVSKPVTPSGCSTAASCGARTGRSAGISASGAARDFTTNGGGPCRTGGEFSRTRRAAMASGDRGKASNLLHAGTVAPRKCHPGRRVVSRRRLHGIGVSGHDRIRGPQRRAPRTWYCRMPEMKNYRPRADLLKDRVILVTGASRGIGRVAALAFAAMGRRSYYTGAMWLLLEAVYDEVKPAAVRNQLPSLRSGQGDDSRLRRAGLRHRIATRPARRHSAQRIARRKTLAARTAERRGMEPNAVAPGRPFALAPGKAPHTRACWGPPQTRLGDIHPLREPWPHARGLP